MNKVYSVQGSYFTGDYYEWIVATYPDREAAEQHVRLANDLVERNSSLRGEDAEAFWNEFPYDNKNNFPSDWNYDLRRGYQPNYVVSESVFVRHVDEYMEKSPVQVWGKQ